MIDQATYTVQTGTLEAAKALVARHFAEFFPGSFEFMRTDSTAIMTTDGDLFAWEVTVTARAT